MRVRRCETGRSNVGLMGKTFWLAVVLILLPTGAVRAKPFQRLKVQ